MTSEVARWLRARVTSEPSIDDVVEMSRVLRTLAKWRSQVLANTFVAHHGPVVLQGPFAGMTYVAATEGALIARLLGAYESELHPYIEGFATAGVECVIDVGCAEGYYAVGLARKMPAAMVYAYDTNPAARSQCAALAARNGVSERVVIGGELKPEGFEAFAGRRCLVIADTEGAEDEILRPDLSPALARMAIIVDTHDLYRPGVCARLAGRFEATHKVIRVDGGPKTLPLPAWLTGLSHLDQLLAVWEWRSRPTPWLVMMPR